MNRRTFLQATAMAWAGYSAGDAGTAGVARGTDGAAVPAGDPAARGTERWFLDWLPPAVLDGSGAAAFGTSPVPPEGRAAAPTATGRRYLHRLADHARVTVAAGVDAAAERRLLERGGYERLGGPGYELFGRASGRRYRSVALLDGADVAVAGVGPAAEPAVAGVRAVAATDGTDVARDTVLGDLLGYVRPARHLSVELRPAPSVAGAAEALEVGRERSRLRTMVIPDAGSDDRVATDYLRSLDGEAGVVSASTGRRGRAVVREAVLRTSALNEALEGSHAG